MEPIKIRPNVFDAEGNKLEIGDNVIYGGTGLSPKLTRQKIIDLQVKPDGLHVKVLMTNKKSTSQSSVVIIKV